YRKSILFVIYFFFFQAEDGIRDFHVTGVQTCALPIFLNGVEESRVTGGVTAADPRSHLDVLDQSGEQLAALSVDDRLLVLGRSRSEERRVGNWMRIRWSPVPEKEIQVWTTY